MTCSGCRCVDLVVTLVTLRNHSNRCPDVKVMAENPIDALTSLSPKRFTVARESKYCSSSDLNL